MRNYWDSITKGQKAWILGSTLAILLLGIIAGDTPINLFIGTIGMFYVAVYGTGKTRWAFILGIIYVSVYTIICLQNRIMLDAIQNIVLIPLYAYSFFYWGKNNITPKNMTKKHSVFVLLSAVVVCVALFGLSKILNGNYSGLDAITTTSTLYAMILGIYGVSGSWWFWTINNTVSVIIFGLALSTPTGSLVVFAMKMVFFINGIIGFVNWAKNGKLE